MAHKSGYGGRVVKKRVTARRRPTAARAKTRRRPTARPARKRASGLSKAKKAMPLKRRRVAYRREDRRIKNIKTVAGAKSKLRSMKRGIGRIRKRRRLPPRITG